MKTSQVTRNNSSFTATGTPSKTESGLLSLHLAADSVAS